MKTMMKTLVATILATAALTAHAETVVVVSAKSPTTKLTTSQVAEIFLGRSEDMTPVDLADKETRTGFYKKVADKEIGQVKAIWAMLVFTGKAIMPRELSNSAEVRKVVAADPSTIGYMDKSAVDSSVRVLLTLQ